MSVPALIEAVCLRNAYGARLAIEDLTFNVNAGEIVGLLGPNGAGKTTTLSILATFIAPDAGEVRIAGIDSRVAPDSLRRKLGFVPQSIALYPPLSAFRNLEIFARIDGLTRRLADARRLEVLESVGLRDRANDPVWTLSGGMKRRLHLACGMVHRPELLLLGEPTVGVDPHSREGIFAKLRTTADSGVAILYSTHYYGAGRTYLRPCPAHRSGQSAGRWYVAQLIELGGHRPRMEMVFKRFPLSGWYEGIQRVVELAPAIDEARVILELTNLRQVNEILERVHTAHGQLLEFAGA